jgi:hypothetical protein
LKILTKGTINEWQKSKSLARNGKKNHRRREGNRLLCPEEQSGDHLIGAGLHPQYYQRMKKEYYRRDKKAR